ncbi:hypothetical protein P9Z39_20980 [Bacillus thuringiensis]|uniref:hypothetical protein n=1 Tax=Bacillus thuringiensis TaxID=1428 RepID=UPI000A381501|nr:hypothetical protein [Bacillus thuringiensis]MEC2708130.1 hypothetical protein [Bacillus thuringiensis]OUB76496.1 hypothetical protein BK765_02345 [Bacillus thuringiensis serovar dakota]
MLENLITEGVALEAKAEEGEYTSKYFDCVEFEQWTSKVAMFFEINYAGSVVTEKVITKYKACTVNNSYDVYQLLLGSLKAVKELATEEV